ncbi:MAG: glycosyltransferase family 4 protein [Gammaproteobacteria bacterium]|nr:glycosyltransferase family 4 protein [Gammaproteobacteria bacterium]
MHDHIEVILPSLKRRLSGVTATLVRLLPIQAKSMNIVAAGPGGLPDDLPTVSIWSLFFMGRKKLRVWHARRNTEMLLGLILQKAFRKNLKLVFTSASQRHHTRYTRFLISRMDAVIATSRKSASYLECPAQVIPHGIDTGTFHPAADKSAVRRSLNIPDGILIGCYGRIRHQKGTDVFVDSMLELLPEFPNAAALVMGRATSRHQGFLNGLRQKVKEAGLEDRILFLPESPVDTMSDWYRVLDLFVAPQRWEGFGLTPLESMACGVPVIATDVGAFDELIEESKTGIIIPPGDKEKMIRAVHAMISSPERIQGWAIQCRQHMELNFRIEDEAGSINALYRSLLSEGTGTI